MKFTHAHILFWLWTLVPVAAVMAYGIRTRKRVLDRFVRPQLQSGMVPGFSQVPDWIRFFLVLAGLGLALFSLSGPQAGFKWEKTRQRGVDIMIALDCSRSMLATDVSPNRLERAKREIIDLTRLMHSDRAGLVAFSGKAVLQCPLTMDYEAFQIFLDVLGPDYLPVGGTNLAGALDTCLKGFDTADTQKAIIVITDGEDTAEQGKEALDRLVETLAKEEIRVFAIGVGDPSGAPIPDAGGGFKRDRAGEVILSRVDEAGLRRLAADTGGRYVRSVAGDMDLEQIYGQDILKTMERSTFVEGKKKVWENRFQWVLFPAVLFFLAEFFLGEGRKRKSRAPGKGRGTAAGIVLVCLCFWSTAGPARAGIFSSPVKEGMAAYEKGEFQQAKKLFIDAQLDNPDDPRLYYDIGVAAYAAGEYELARDNFSQALAATDPKLRQDARFNLANTRYRMGDLKGAVQGYEQLLKDFPQDTQAKENLEFVRKKLEEQKKEQQRQDQQQKKDRQDKKTEKENPQKSTQDSRQGEKPPDSPDQNRGKGQKETPKQENGKKGSDAGDREKDQAKTPQPGQQPGQNPHQESGQKTGQTSGQTPDQKPGQTSGGAEGQPLSREAARMLESKLNRLNDMPGKALMPAGGDLNIERDW